VVWATLLSVLFATHGGYLAAAGLVALFFAELFRFGLPRREIAASRTPTAA
jgi:hypothetical protein